MRNVLVIRFGALGDLCLLATTLARAAGVPGARRVTLVTKPAFAPLMAEVRGVDEVATLPPGGMTGVWRLATALRRRHWDAVIDAHAILRGHLLLACMGRRPDARLAKDTVARLVLLAAGRGTMGLDRTMRDRFDALLPALVDGPAAATSSTVVFPGLVAPIKSGPPVLGIAPGARWDTKRWPPERFAALMDWHAASGGLSRLFLGPQESVWFDRSPLAPVARETGAEVMRGNSLVEVAHGLAGCAVAVTNDSGLLHLAEAVGTPVVGLFGPTVKAFGYFPCRPDSVALEMDLECRPCSRNGRRACHRGDLACLERIPVAAVQAALAPLLHAAAKDES